jgi:hypothetical protein
LSGTVVVRTVVSLQPACPRDVSDDLLPSVLASRSER